MRRSGLWRGICLGAIVVLAVAAGARADRLSKAVDGLAKDIIETKRSAALGIAIDQGGKMLLDKGYGYADLEKKIRATPETIFRIGSVTKQFTAVAIVQLQLAGKLALDDPITKVLTDYPAPPKTVTIKNLLQHTSGIHSFTSLPSYIAKMKEDVTHADIIARFDTLPLDFDPGTKWNYSNSGYYLLGMIIERASGESYADYLAKHVLAPAGLQHTRYEAPDGSGRAQGYRRNGKELAVAGPLSMTQPFSAGALVSTASDLVAWQRALVERRMNPPDAFDRITGDLAETGAPGKNYGYGISVAMRDDVKGISHGGGINGFTSLLIYFPGTDRTIAILANTEGFNAGALGELIVEAMDENATSADKKKGRR